MSMQPRLTIITYKPGECPRELLTEAIRANPDQNYVLVPANMIRRLGLTEHHQEREIDGSFCRKVV